MITVNSTTFGTSSAPTGDRIINNPMSYISSTTAQASNAIVYKGTNKNEILRISVVMSSGTASTLKLMDFTTSGTTNTADISSAKLYYTGTSSTYATTTLVGTS